MKNIDLPLEIRTKEKNECIDIKEIEHEGGEIWREKKEVATKMGAMRRKRDGLCKDSSTQAQSCEFPGKTA